MIKKAYQKYKEESAKIAQEAAAGITESSKDNDYQCVNGARQQVELVEEDVQQLSQPAQPASIQKYFHDEGFVDGSTEGTITPNNKEELRQQLEAI